MARPPSPGSVIVPDWHESAEGKEYLACILRKNRRRVFGKSPLTKSVTCHALGRTVTCRSLRGPEKQGRESLWHCTPRPWDPWCISEAPTPKLPES